MKRLLQVSVLALLAVIAFSAWAVYWHPLWVADEHIRYSLWRSGVKSDYVAVDGYRIHYFEATSTRAGLDKPILLIHGLGSHGEDWSPMIPSLAASGYHVYALDLLGYGRSVQPDVNYSIALEETISVDFLDVLHVGQASVAGYSMGGWIAMKMAIDHPTRVDRLLLYDSAGTQSVQRIPPGLFTPQDDAGVTRLVSMLQAHPPPMPAFVVRDALRKLNRNAWIIDRSMEQLRSGGDFIDMRLGEIHQPTLIVWGREDRLIPLAAGEQIHHGIAGSQLVIVEDCGHVAGPQAWPRVTAATLDFLEAQPAPSGGERTLPRQ